VTQSTALPSTYEATSLRPLGALEHIFWLMDQNFPAHFVMIAGITGTTAADDWRPALDAVQRRHPLLRAAIFVNPSGMPEFYEDVESKIPLRIVDGALHNWESEVEREKATGFHWKHAPLVRCVLVHKANEATLIVAAHHSVSDAAGILFVIRDILQALSGCDIVPLPLPRNEEELIGQHQRKRDSPQSPPNDAGAPRTLPSTFRKDDGAPIRVSHLRLSQESTATLRQCARDEQTTVHAALCAALVTAGRGTIWRDNAVRVFSPVNIRELLGVGEDCVVCLGAGARDSFDPQRPSEFWDLARFAKEQIGDQKTIDGAIQAKTIWESVATKDLTVEATANVAANAFARDMMVSNVGVVPFDTKFGDLTLETIWGPVTLGGLEGEYNVGVATTNGSLSVIATSYLPSAFLLEQAESILMDACIKRETKPQK
jgi:hypothetical protein